MVYRVESFGEDSIDAIQLDGAGKPARGYGVVWYSGNRRVCIQSFWPETATEDTLRRARRAACALCQRLVDVMSNNSA